MEEMIKDVNCQVVEQSASKIKKVLNIFNILMFIPYCILFGALFVNVIDNNHINNDFIKIIFTVLTLGISVGLVFINGIVIKLMYSLCLVIVEIARNTRNA